MGAREVRLLGDLNHMNTESVENIRKGVKLFQGAISALNRGPLDYYLIELTDAFNEFVRRCSRFQIGDRVELVRAVDPDRSSGWYSYRGCLIPGNPGTITQVGYNSLKNRFSYYVRFDRESYIKDDGEEVSNYDAEKHGVFSLCETQLCPATAAPAER